MLYPDTTAVHTITLAFTGASGMAYGLRLLECLLAADKTVWLLYSSAAQTVAAQETDFALLADPAQCQKMLCAHFQVRAEQLRVFGKNEWFAPPASGSHVADAMVICPASMGSVAAIAAGMSDNLIERAADVCIKEKRLLIVVPREMPLSAIHLENLLKLARLGVCVLPAAPGFYQRPQSVADLVDFVVARILDQLRIPHNLMPKWGGK
ncbi:flavin prenyltransferase UbiX [Stenoxybacter acetivorans]|uniref:flavin prenyltransferase UbiX n=1 Tax=Stenoxybacter acetivorans TaxID=422441 RepID=UPI000560FF0B|nr:flavin prenyltransferase UbiX [Stenoxybacter acetivorans]